MGGEAAGRPRGDVGLLGDGATSEPDFHAAHELRRRLQGPRGAHLPEQPLVDQRARRGRRRRRPSPSRAARTACPACASTATTCSRSTACSPTPSTAGARRGRAHVHRGAHLPHRRALHERRPHALSLASRGRSLGRKDPLDRLAPHLGRVGLFDDEDEARSSEELDGRDRRAVAEVEPLGPPVRASLFDDVYAELPWHLASSADELEKIRRSRAGAHGCVARAGLTRRNGTSRQILGSRR